MTQLYNARGKTHRVARVGRDTTAFEPRHVSVSKGILGQTRQRRHVNSVGIDSRSLFQDTTSFRALEHMIQQTWKHGSGSCLSDSGHHIYGMPAEVTT